MDPRALYESDDTDWLERPDGEVETNWVERKKWTDARGLAEQVSGFANGHPPGGLIVIRVSTDGQIVGVDDRSPEELVKKLGHNIDGQLGRDWEYRFVPTPAGGRLLFVYVPVAVDKVLCLSDGTTVEKLGTERNVIRDRWFDGPLPKIVDDFHEFMGTQVRTFEYLGPAGTFVREPEYPEAAWQEAVVNALVHRSYTLQNTPVFVRLFDDRIEVESPGGYPGGNHPDEEGVFPRPYPRNPAIAGALQYLGLVWLAREGTRRMHDDMKKLGLPVPEFRDDGGTKVVVTLKNDIDRRRAKTGSEESARQWQEVEQLLREELAFLRSRALEKWESNRSPSSKEYHPPRC